jgi:hypothetical protein
VKKQFDFRKMSFYQIWIRSFCDGNGDGIGDLYGVYEKLPYIKRVASLSPYNPKVTMTMDAENVAIFVGETSYGEDSASVKAANNLAETYGYEPNFKATNHGSLPGVVFEIDAELGYPVVLDWLLSN